MARPIPDLDEMEANEVALDDDLLIDDVSAAETKRIQVGKLIGLPTIGWTAAGETHTYSSWTSATRIGVITVPSDATTKYSPGMRYWINQSTGGNKYGIITKVTSTTLTVFFPSGTTLNNEAISSPYYSVQKAPFGFPLSPTLWTLQLTSTTDRTISTAGWASTSETLSVGIGAWHVMYKGTILQTLSNLIQGIKLSLSTDGSTETDPDMSTRMAGRENGGGTDKETHQTLTMDKFMLFASATTLTLMSAKVNSSNGTLYGSQTATVIRAVCAYL